MKFKPQILLLLLIPFFFGMSILAYAEVYTQKTEYNIVSFFFTILGFILAYFIAKTFPKYFFYLLILGFISSCCPKVTTIKEVTTIHDTTTIETRIKVIDTFIDTDTLTQVIKLECDSAGKVHIVENKEVKGKRSSVVSKLANNTLISTFKCDSLHIVNQYLDSLVKSYRLEKREKETVNTIIEYRMPFWGWLLIGAAISYALYSRFK